MAEYKPSFIFHNTITTSSDIINQDADKTRVSTQANADSIVGSQGKLPDRNITDKLSILGDLYNIAWTVTNDGGFDCPDGQELMVSDNGRIVCGFVDPSSSDYYVFSDEAIENSDLETVRKQALKNRIDDQLSVDIEYSYTDSTEVYGGSGSFTTEELLAGAFLPYVENIEHRLLAKTYVEKLKDVLYTASLGVTPPNISTLVSKYNNDVSLGKLLMDARGPLNHLFNTLSIALNELRSEVNIHLVAEGPTPSKSMMKVVTRAVSRKTPRRCPDGQHWEQQGSGPNDGECVCNEHDNGFQGSPYGKTKDGKCVDCREGVLNSSTFLPRGVPPDNAGFPTFNPETGECECPEGQVQYKLPTNIANGPGEVTPCTDPCPKGYNFKQVFDPFAPTDVNYTYQCVCIDRDRKVHTVNSCQQVDAGGLRFQPRGESCICLCPEGTMAQYKPDSQTNENFPDLDGNFRYPNIRCRPPCTGNRVYSWADDGCICPPDTNCFCDDPLTWDPVTEQCVCPDGATNTSNGQPTKASDCLCPPGTEITGNRLSGFSCTPIASGSYTSFLYDQSAFDNIGYVLTNTTELL